MAESETALLTRYIQLQAIRAGVDPDLAVALARQESGVNPKAVSPKGALGVMQLMPGTARQLGVNPADVFDNIRGGLRYFQQQLERFGDSRLALAAYNAGPGAVEKYGGVPPYKETQGYVRRILGAVRPAGAEAAAATDPPGLRPADRVALEERVQQLKAARARLSGGTVSGADQPETFPPLAEQEAAASRQALFGPTPAPGPAQAPREAPAPSPAYEVDVQALGPPGTSQGPREPATGSAPLPAGVLQTPAGGIDYNAYLPPPGKAAGALGMSTAGSMLGTTAGTLAMPFLGPLAPAGPVVGEMAGSYLGRRVNVALGLEEPGVVGDIASVAVPPFLRGVGKGAEPIAKAVVRKLPGASTAMHQEVWERMGQMKQRLLPPVDSDTLYATVAQYNPPIAPTAVGREAADVLAAEMALQPSLRNPRLVRVARDLRRLTQGGNVPMEELYAHQQRVGELVRDFRSKGGVGEGRIKQLYAAFHEDLETAATKGVQGAQELKDAIAASRKEHIAAEFDEMFQPGKGGITADPEGRISLHGGRMKTAWDTKLRRDKVFRDTLDQAEQAEVEEILTLARRLERLRAPKGVQFGSGRALARGGIASTLAVLTGMNPIIVGGIAMNAPEVIGKAMQTSAGRKLVKKSLEASGGALDTTAITALAALVRSQMTAPESEPPAAQ